MRVTVLLAMVVVVRRAQGLAVPIAGENDSDDSQKQASDLESEFYNSDNSTEDSRARSVRFNRNKVLVQTDCECGRKLMRNRIVGGVVTEGHEYPWQAAITISPDDRQVCGGSLITDRHVLTAAHCVYNMLVEEMRVRLREYKLSDPSETFELKRRVKSYKIHKNYDPEGSLDYDMAIITLMTPVTIQRTLLPVCLPSNPDKTYAGKIGKVTGWGRIADAGPGSDELREVDLPILSNRNCKRNTNYSPDQITPRMLCAGEEGKGHCRGDSGGPMVYEDFKGRYDQIGVVSWHGGECAEDGFPSVYNRVTKYLKWIERNTKDGVYCRGFKFPE